ncbi:MAG TPA: hypothetical protein VIF62_30540 [Labilithrix sp.]
MRIHILFAASSLLLVSAPALAQETDQPDSQSHAEILPRQIDAKGMLRTSAVLQYGGVGVASDVGVARAGPGTIAVGGSLAYEACATSCWGMPYAFAQHQTYVEGRASYRLGAAHIANLELYPLMTLGVVIAGSSFKMNDVKYDGSSFVPTVGFGGGASYSFAKHFFAFAEATLRYAAGTYDYGNARAHDSAVDTWSSNTIALAMGAGARF